MNKLLICLFVIFAIMGKNVYADAVIELAPIVVTRQPHGPA